MTQFPGPAGRRRASVLSPEATHFAGSLRRRRPAQPFERWPFLQQQQQEEEERAEIGRGHFLVDKPGRPCSSF